MSDEPKKGTIRLVPTTTWSVTVDLDGIRKSTGIGEPDSAFLPMAIARTLLAEIDRLSACVDAMDHRIQDLEIDAARRDGRR